MKIGRDITAKSSAYVNQKIISSIRIESNLLSVTYCFDRLSLNAAKLVNYWCSASKQNQNEQEHEQIPLPIENHLRTAIVLLCTSGFTGLNWHVISWQLCEIVLSLPNVVRRLYIFVYLYNPATALFGEKTFAISPCINCKI